ncbi:MAG: hypothetical protein HN509_09555 [Halobacteriovoraceae bacterium]|nr:hypothetical protein [Halobacteriovoraceae bacterium]MBT5094885.1 hypothetical protein [Halobacteriovoraceae bacterium]
MEKLLGKLFWIYLTLQLAWLPAFSYEDELVLKGGVNAGRMEITGFNGSEDNSGGVGFNTHFGYKWTKWEFALSSYIYYGKVDQLAFQGNSSQINGNGSFRHVSFGPLLKYLTDYQPFKNYNFYFGGGPSWSLQTIKLEDFRVVSGEFKRQHKLTYRSFGGLLVFGIEEQMAFKQQHPVYVEFVYSYMAASKVSVVDAGDFSDTNILSESKPGQSIETWFWMISAGIALF